MSPVLKIAAAVLLVSLMLHVGMQVDRQRLREVLTNYGLLLRALLANFVVVPLLGVLFVRLFHVRETIAIGILLMAISPGGRGILLSGGSKKGGSLGFAIELSFLLPAVSIVTIPFTAHLLLPQAEISTKTLYVVLGVFQLVPLLAGVFINERLPKLADALRRPVIVVMFVALLLVLVPLTPTLVRSIGTVYGSYGMLAMVAIVCCSMVTGWIFAGAGREYRRTAALGTAMRSFAFCALLAARSFPGAEPVAAVCAYFIVQLVVTSLVGVYFARTAAAVPA